MATSETPYDTWFNGDIGLQIKNGTYAQYREVHARNHTEEELQAFDKQNKEATAAREKDHKERVEASVKKAAAKRAAKSK